MFYSYFGCLITSFLSFQSFINYPCTRSEIYGNYTRILVKENQFWNGAVNWSEQYQLNVRTPIQESQIPGAKNVLWTCKRYLGPGHNSCLTMQALQVSEADTQEDREVRTLFIRGCPLQNPIHPSLCAYINAFPTN